MADYSTDYPIILYTKDKFTFKKNNVNDYSLSFQLENNAIHLDQIIDFNLVKLIYDLNVDIYEQINLQIINEDEANINMLMKHLFEDVGLPQRYSYVKIKRYFGENKIYFKAETIKDKKPNDMPMNAELAPIKNMILNFDLVSKHKIDFSCNVTFDNTMFVPPVAEKLIGIILNKIFSRLKLFIDNVKV